ncbi:hypothetical protein DYBT9623_00727 [Dyadobacter sp. CECT 9623]|uniref:Uncharacterized protein n=1 Tax=Dyadobacter linearis TaxID=2823330 RepID=A0ABM8UKL1_9BACT|nr:hypothetical protein DYBT9623_00727 [Dyadobacter sp. CECT 9623]
MLRQQISIKCDILCLSNNVFDQLRKETKVYVAPAVKLGRFIN